MERVHLAALFDRASGGHQGLSRHLPTEDALALLVGALASEDVDLDGFEVEETDERVEGVGHLLMVTRPRYSRRVRLVPTAIADRARTPTGRKALRYTLVSVVSVGVSQVALFALFGLAEWTARSANYGAFVAGGIPSYILNRRWTWGKTGRSHIMREVVPYWGLALLGLVLSTFAVSFAEDWAHDVTDTRLVQALIVNGSSIAAFGLLWVGKFFLFNKVIFVSDEDLRAALADEVVA
jgi:putative flippase GtrA